MPRRITRALSCVVVATQAFASYLMALAPLVLVYIFAQRWVISGVTRGSVK
jgi:raffinose/stachyose/melibiose transport system permease protein